jgi:lipopolysaccharide export system protein LptA
VLVLVGLAGSTASAVAQQQPLSSALGGFGRSSAPIDIQADKLVINDTKKTAIYRGNVVAVQGEYTLRTVELEVFYASKDGQGAAKGAQPRQAARTPGEESQQITRILAKQKVIMTSAKDQTATGDLADYNVAEQKVVITGDEVFLKQGENVLKGKKLTVDLKTGETLMEGGRVSTVLHPRQGEQGKSGAPTTAPGAPAERKTAPGSMTPPTSSWPSTTQPPAQTR